MSGPRHLETQTLQHEHDVAGAQPGSKVTLSGADAAATPPRRRVVRWSGASHAARTFDSGRCPPFRLPIDRGDARSEGS